MNVIGQFQTYIAMGLGVAALGLEAWAFVDALRRRPDAFVAADKRTKGFWLAVTGVALAVGFVTFTSIVGMLGLLAVIAAGVYLADVKPALDRVMGKGRRDGPYGPWRAKGATADQSTVSSPKRHRAGPARRGQPASCSAAAVARNRCRAPYAV